MGGLADGTSARHLRERPPRVRLHSIENHTFHFIHMSQIPGFLHRHTPRLPLEVLEHVIGFVGYLATADWWGNYYRLEALRHCALVCRSWLTKSRVYLYDVVHLNNKRKATTFMTTIVSSPRLGEYVHELWIDLESKHTDWLYSAHQVLPPFLPNLSRLGYFQLPSLHPVFFALSTKFKTVTSLRLGSFESWTFREIVRLLNSFPNLKTLDIDCRWSSPSPFYCRNTRQQKYSHTLFRLTCYVLSVDETDNVLHWLTKKQYCPLDAFSILGDSLPIQSQHLAGLLYRSNATLTSLDLTFDPGDEKGKDEKRSNVFDPDGTWLPALTACINLKDFRICLPNPDNTHWFLELLLSNLPGSLCRIALSYWDTVTSSDIFSSGSTKDPDSSKTLDNGLTRSKFPKLAYVEIRWYEHGFKSPERFEDTLIQMHQQGLFKRSLPKIYEHRILRCGSRSSELVYPITEPIMTKLASAGTGDRELWRRRSHDRLFRYSQR